LSKAERIGFAAIIECPKPVSVLIYCLHEHGYISKKNNFATLKAFHSLFRVCVSSEFVSETVSRAGFGGFTKNVSHLQMECTKLPNPKPVSVRFLGLLAFITLCLSRARPILKELRPKLEQQYKFK